MVNCVSGGGVDGGEDVGEDGGEGLHRKRVRSKLLRIVIK